MSGLLERIVRRHRAPASSRPGVAPRNGTGVVRQDGAAEGELDAGAGAADGGRAGAAPEHGSDGGAGSGAAANGGAAEGGGESAPGTRVGPPGFVERGRLRRRARYLRRLREVQLRDLGGFMLELHRFGRQRPDIVQAKVSGAAATDTELRALERALASEQPLRELREAGIGGACAHCGSIHGSADRYCAACGRPLAARTQPGIEAARVGESDV
jgi:hypothetical protein